MKKFFTNIFYNILPSFRIAIQNRDALAFEIQQISELKTQLLEMKEQLERYDSLYQNILGDSYQSPEKENTGKRMKLIQSQDSSTYSFDRPITAKEVKTRSNIQKGAFEFRFIIPSTTSTDGKDRFYYNYKTASGESVVMYALRTIIDEAKKNIEDPDEKLKTFFIGDTDSDGFRTIQPSTEHKFTYRYKITDSNSSIIEGNGQYNKSVSGNDSYALYRIASEFDHKIPYNGSTYLFECPESEDKCTQTKTITDNDRTYTIEVEYLTWQGINLPYEDTSVNDSKIKSQEKSGFPLFNFKNLKV